MHALNMKKSHWHGCRPPDWLTDDWRNIHKLRNPLWQNNIDVRVLLFLFLLWFRLFRRKKNQSNLILQRWEKINCNNVFGSKIHNGCAVFNEKRQHAIFAVVVICSCCLYSCIFVTKTSLRTHQNLQIEKYEQNKLWIHCTSLWTTLF